MDIRLSDIGHIIQLSIAPVFLLTGVGTNLLVLTNRLARIIDRSRYLEEKLEMLDISADAEKKIRLEAGILFLRARKINRAIALSTLCALFICIVVASLFLDDAFNLKINTLIAMLFVSAMVSLTGSFIYLLREILMATEFLNKQNWHLHKS
jgi:energy-converting hydrogenase Eha subunit C